MPIYPSTQLPNNIKNLFSVGTIALLKSNTSLINLGRVFLEKHTTDGYGSGEFYWDSSSLETDNNGTIIQVTGITTGRWKRILKNGIINVEDFGVTATSSSTANGLAWNRAITLASTNGGTIRQSVQGTVLVPCEAGALSIRSVSGIVIEILDGSIIKTIPSTINPGASPVFTVVSSSNIVFKGNGIIRGNRVELGGTMNEFGAGIYIANSTNVVIKDLTIDQTAGDGITIGCQDTNATVLGASSNVLVENVTLYKNGRNSIALTGANDVRIINCRASYADLNLPRLSIDFEPDLSTNIKNTNIKIVDFNSYQTGATAAYAIGHIAIGGYGNEDIQIIRPYLRGGANGIDYTQGTKRLLIKDADIDTGDWVQANASRAAIRFSFASYYGQTNWPEDISVIGGTVRGGWLCCQDVGVTKNLVYRNVNFLVTFAGAKAFSFVPARALIKDCTVRVSGTGGVPATSDINTWTTYMSQDVISIGNTFINETTSQTLLMGYAGSNEKDDFYIGRYVRNSSTNSPGRIQIKDATGYAPGTWAAQTSSVDATFVDIESNGNGTTIGVASGSNLTRSVNGGTTWANVTIPGYQCQAIAYGKGIWVIASDTSTILRSVDDGLTYTYTASIISNPSSVAFGADVFVIANLAGAVAWSSDGYTWSAVTMPSTAKIRAVEYIPSLRKFIAVCGTGLAASKSYYSETGKTWSEGTSVENTEWNSVCDAEGSAIAFAYSGTKRGMRTYDGYSWEEVTLPVTGAWYSCSSGNGLIVACSQANGSIWSLDGKNFTTLALPTNFWRTICFDKKYQNFIALSVDGSGNRAAILPRRT